MTWVDMDYLAEGVEKVREALRQHIVDLEALLGPGDDTPPHILCLYTIDEGVLSEAADPNKAPVKRIAAARAALRAIEALSELSLPMVTRTLLALDLELAINREERNNDAAEPYRGF